MLKIMLKKIEGVYIREAHAKNHEKREMQGMSFRQNF